MKNTFIVLRENLPYCSNMLNRPLGLQIRNIDCGLIGPRMRAGYFFGVCRMLVKGERLLLYFFQNICALWGIACCKSATHGVNIIAGPFHLQAVDCSLLCMTPWRNCLGLQSWLTSCQVYNDVQGQHLARAPVIVESRISVAPSRLTCGSQHLADFGL